MLLVNHIGNDHVSDSSHCPFLCFVLTSFAHHGGDKLGDNGASFPHLTLLAVGEVREDARDTSGTRCPACVHHNQHLHYGGVHVSETAEGRRQKTNVKM